MDELRKEIEEKRQLTREAANLIVANLKSEDKKTRSEAISLVVLVFKILLKIK